MDKFSKNNSESKKIIRFRKGSFSRHFAGTGNIKSDVLGSYTGTPDTCDNATFPDDMYPVQDADDL